MKERIQKLKKQLGVKTTDDPDGVMAVLQIARRLISDEGDTAIYAVLDDAIRMAAPRDHAKAWWTAHYALQSQLPTGFQTLGEFSTQVSTESLVNLFDAAIRNQGTINLAVKRNTKGRKESE